MTRTRLLAPLVLAVLACPWFIRPSVVPAHAGGVPAKIPSDWVVAQTVPEGDILRTLAQIPHDPNPLGVREALALRKPYPTPSNFHPVQFKSNDGTLLAGRIALWPDGKSRPGVVLVNGLSQNKDLKSIVELAELFYSGGWHVLTFDPRGHGESRALSAAMPTFGWKEAEDVLGAVGALKANSSTAAVAVIGFSAHGRALVRAMADDQGKLIDAGIAVTAPLGEFNRPQPPPPGWTPTPVQKYFLDFLGAPSFYDHAQKAARAYGVDLETWTQRLSVTGAVARVSRPLLLLYALDDTLMLAQLKGGRHDGGDFSLAYRDTVKDHRHVRTLLVERGNHSGLLYLSDPHWFARVTMTFLKHAVARDHADVKIIAPPLDILADGALDGPVARYRVLVRNHGAKPVGPVEINVQLPSGAQVESCWVGFEGLARCETDGARVRWTISRLAGGKTTAGPFHLAVHVGRLKPGAFETEASISSVNARPDAPDTAEPSAVPQRVILTKP